MGYDTFVEAYNIEILLAPNTTQNIVVERDGERVTLAVHVEGHETQGHGLQPGWGLSWGGDETPLILGVGPESPAEQAGILAGDAVLGANGQRPIAEIDLRVLIEANADQEMTLEIGRDDRELTVTVIPRSEDGTGRLGVALGRRMVHRDLGLV